MITDKAVGKKGIAPVPALALNRFVKYGPEEGHLVRNAELKKDKTLEELKELYHKTKGAYNPPQLAYDRMAGSLKNHNYSAADIERFSIVLAELQSEARFSENAGIFLSALLNNGKEDDYIVHTAHLSNPMDWLGFRNTKNIRVKGGAGTLLGLEMEGGTLTVEGNVVNRVGADMTGGTIIVMGDAAAAAGGGMKAGTVIVKGDVDYWAGEKMEGGILIVEGDAHGDTGRFLKGGEIHIEGEIASTDDVIHGKIYHKGKLIVDK